VGRFLARPLDAAFYRGVCRAGGDVRERRVLSGFEGAAIDVEAGSLLSLELLEKPQIVGLFAFNRDDPLERVWHQSLISESVFLTPVARLWGTLPLNRPLLTMVLDSLTDRLGPGHAHHVGLGGSGTPADWAQVGGRPDVATTWEQLSRLLEARGAGSHLLTQNVSLFQRSRIDPVVQSVEVLPSLARTGDRVAFFAEIDLCVLLALSPYLDGAVDPGDPVACEPGAVRIEVTRPVAAPLGWPYDAAPDRGSDHRVARGTGRALRRARYPFDAAFYERVAAAEARPVSRKLVPGGSGHGFRVEAGSTFAFTLVEGAQIVDVCLVNADDPAEYYATGPQLAIEGGRIGRWTRLWGNAPRSRPLATCVADSVGARVRDGLLANHISHSDCCSGAFWLAVSGRHRRSCYDNLCDALAMVGLDARAFQGNVNLFMSAALDPDTGDLVEGKSTAVRGDKIVFYAEIPLHVALSVCPAGPGGPPGDRPETKPHAVEVEVAETGIAPLGWG
jgi:uncharacterized protein YcgI (DUF1989 family)